MAKKHEDKSIKNKQKKGVKEIKKIEMKYRMMNKIELKRHRDKP